MELIEHAVLSQYTFTNTMNEYGYETKTTFYQDFTIADAFGEMAILDTFERAFNDWKTNIVFLTELSIVLNHKIWEHYHKKNDNITQLYDRLWKKTDQYCMETLKGADLDYYVKVTD